MVLVVANSSANGNVRHGEAVFRKGITDPIEVFKAHLWWDRGAAADHHFENGYRAAAEEAGFNPTEALRLFHPLRSDEDKEIRKQLYARRSELPCPF